MFSKFDEEARKVLTNMAKEMSELNHPYIGSEHLLLSILKYGSNEIKDKFNKYKVSYKSFKDELIKVVGVGSKKNEYYLYTPLLKSVIEIATVDSLERGKKEVDIVDLILALFTEGDGIAVRILLGMNISIDQLLEDFSFSLNRTKNNSKLLINSYGVNLNEKAKNNELDPVVGREKEVKQIMEILSRRCKNNPLLIGEAGVGKTAIVEEVARVIEDGNVSNNLLNKKIISVSMSSLVAGTKYRGEFEEKIEKIIKELENNEDIILFIDEIHTIMGAGGAEGAIDASNILKPALARGKIKLIGATTTKEYKEFIEKDKAFARRFQVVNVNEPSLVVTKDILLKIKPLYEDYHKVLVSDELIDKIIYYSNKYIYNKKMPDKAIDVLDQVCSRVSNRSINKQNSISKIDKMLEDVIIKKNSAIIKNDLSNAFFLKQEELNLENERSKILSKTLKQGYKKVKLDDIKEIISELSKIPVTNNYSNDDLKKMKNGIKNIILGQDGAVDDVFDVYKSMIYKYDDKPKSMLFVGSTGVGKTLLAKEFANIYCGKDNLIRLDMSEFKEGHAISKIIGSPPGYIGYNDNNNVFEKVKDNPYSVILLDEIEKANNNVVNLFLQILDEGYATNSKGERINFNNCIIIMTSNLSYNKGNIGFNDKNVSARNNEIEKVLSKEFVNRIDKIVYFSDMTSGVVNNIIDLKLKSIKNNYLKDGISLKFSKKVKDEIINLSLYKMYGARKIDKIISEYINVNIIDNIINGNKNIYIDSIREKVV